MKTVPEPQCQYRGARWPHLPFHLSKDSLRLRLPDAYCVPAVNEILRSLLDDVHNLFITVFLSFSSSSSSSRCHISKENYHWRRESCWPSRLSVAEFSTTVHAWSTSGSHDQKFLYTILFHLHPVPVALHLTLPD